MNCEVYVYGIFDEGYTQYHLDYTQDIFLEFIRNSKSEAQIAIHRKDSLMYYSYVRSLSGRSGTYFGMCAVVNGVLLTDLAKLFELYENILTQIVEKGEVVHITKQGNLSSNVKQLFDKRDVLEKIIETVRKDIEHIPSCKLPPENYAVARCKSKRFSYKNKESEIVEASHTYDYVYVYKDDNFDSSAITSWKNVLKNLNSEKKELQKELENLKSEYNKLKRQKRNTTIVTCLIGLIAFGGLLVYNYVLDSNAQIDSLNYSVEDLRAQNDSLQNSLQISEDNVNRLQNEKNSLEREKESLLTEKRTLISENNMLEQENSDLQYENNNLEQNLMYYKPKRYKIWASSGNRASCYYLCSGKFYDMNCSYPDNSEVDVYYTRDGYGLTVGGYVRLSDMKRQ